jgi:hypothetical protein
LLQIDWIYVKNKYPICALKIIFGEPGLPIYELDEEQVIINSSVTVFLKPGQDNKE